MPIFTCESQILMLLIYGEAIKTVGTGKFLTCSVFQNMTNRVQTIFRGCEIILNGAARIRMRIIFLCVKTRKINTFELCYGWCNNFNEQIAADIRIIRQYEVPIDIHKIRWAPIIGDLWRLKGCCTFTRDATRLYQVLLFIVWMGQSDKGS